MTSIFINQERLLKTLESMVAQSHLPSTIYLYLSEESYILDTGFKGKEITNKKLLSFIEKNSLIEVKWVENTGSYRKLLPLLKEKWNEDCIIITILHCNHSTCLHCINYCCFFILTYNINMTNHSNRETLTCFW